MPAIVKGTQSIQLVRIEKRFDPATRTAWTDEHYEGTKDAILGAFRLQHGRRSSVTAEFSEGTGRLIVSKPNGVDDSEFPEDRFEILSEFVEKEIWSSPDIVLEAGIYDALNADIDNSNLSYRKLAEAIAEGDTAYSFPDAGAFPSFAKVVRHLRNGVTGWENEYVVLRRSRRVRRGSPQGQASIGDGLFVYSTSQLSALLPSDVEFSLPNSAALSPSSSDYFWGWRRRPSTSVMQGIWCDQSSEFLLSEWSTIHYTAATDPPSW